MNIIISFVIGATLIYLLTEQNEKDQNAHKMHDMRH